MNAPRLQVLLVDDEAAVLATTAAVLSEDFEVQTAHDAHTARRMLGLRPFDVLCTDLHMPGPSGIQLLREAVIQYPHLAGVLVTGFREYLDWRDRLDAQGLFYLVLKPYQPPDLIAMIRRAAESARLKRDMSRLSSGLAEHKWGPR
ncbi:response regulator [Myxococcus sp. CA051A]|uniref:Response regulator n=1 Tax=Myxococcus llanfairpwllgwyngyllgogerychwyrndrobwllllantysiliogogogochensis TaxID=2590453 RepID=A0A540WW96_9BACT|nr:MULTISPECIES: response regulator [Myxococcus]NTX05372.1 response regulator [Myxococcus sp. CA040A]NTX09999.1 response regulator [Myxococcus sp. CA056]NTX40047.1 response regulator [Myxococcus sp. CA033]NTX58217.1 response regulator [Myxococcus sp. CA039A]NTX64461.1 response regulator [Myxococcus sp. CA051A]